jgi:hypothetical protein
MFILLLAAFVVPNALADCSSSFTDTFEGGSFSNNWVQTAGIGLGSIGAFYCDASTLSDFPSVEANPGGGLKFIIQTAQEMALTLCARQVSSERRLKSGARQSKQTWSPPATFTFDIQGSNAPGTLSDAVIVSPRSTPGCHADVLLVERHQGEVRNRPGAHWPFRCAYGSFYQPGRGLTFDRCKGSGHGPGLARKSQR